MRVKCVDGASVLDAPDPVADAPQPIRTMNSFPRLTVDPRGRVWLAFRHRQEAVWGNQSTQVVGGIWVEYVSVLAGRRWGLPTPLPRSDGLLDNRPALAATGDGPLLVAYSSDGRMHREVDLTPELQARYQPQGGTPAGVSNNDLFLAAVPAFAGADAAAEPSPARETPARIAAPPVHPDEAADIVRMRGYRLAAGGKTYRLLRGDFHRHTELSMNRRQRRHAPRTSGGTRHRRRRLRPGWATTITTAAAARSTPGGLPRRPPTSTTGLTWLATLFTYERARRATRTGTAMSCFPAGATLPPDRQDGGRRRAYGDVHDYLKEHGGPALARPRAWGPTAAT